MEYIDALIADFKADLADFPVDNLTSLFIGGGTPSLISASAYEKLFIELRRLIQFTETTEITLEANPSSVEQQRFKAYRQLGINRLSLGIQSFNNEHLYVLGRVHDANQAHLAIDTAREAGFTNINIDLMHSLPNQSVTQALDDLNTALTYKPEHLSWYQLTLEPNTLFYKLPPPLPHEKTTIQIEKEGIQHLAAKGFENYEISAFCQPGKAAQHNLNYWLFGDYFGIGAGAHSKISQGNKVYRSRKKRQPFAYLQKSDEFIVNKEILTAKMLIFEFMLNTTRLQQEISYTLFTERTGLPYNDLELLLVAAAKKNLIQLNETSWQVTPFGRRFTNDLQAMFLL